MGDLLEETRLVKMKRGVQEGIAEYNEAVNQKNNLVKIGKRKRKA